MTLFRRICLSFTCALVSAASLAGAQQAPPPAPDSTNVGAIAGVVRDERGQPIARARVAIEALAVQTFTDSAGNFVLAGLPARTTSVIFRFLAIAQPRQPSMCLPARHSILALRWCPWPSGSMRRRPGRDSQSGRGACHHRGGTAGRRCHRGRAGIESPHRDQW